MSAATVAPKPHRTVTGKRPIPARLGRSITLWLLAIAAGVAETALVVTQSLLDGTADGAMFGQVLMRVGIYTVLAAGVWLLRSGRNGIRIAVAVVIGGFGLASMIASPIGWLIAGNSPVDFIAGADAWTLGFTALRAGHVVAVIAAMVLMFSPPANRFFRKS